MTRTHPEQSSESAPPQAQDASQHEGTNVDRMIDMAQEAASASDPTAHEEKRSGRRYPYDALVGMVVLSETGKRSEPHVMRARNIAAGGICVIARCMFHIDCPGVMQLVRSNGNTALVGVRVRYSRYIGEMQHEMGLEFTALPSDFTVEDFLDEEGAVRLFDPLLRENIVGKRDGEAVDDAADDEAAA